MKRALLLVVGLAFCLLVSCNPQSGSPTTLLISWSFPSAETVMPATFMPATYDATFTPWGLESVERADVGDSTFDIDAISPGRWNVAIAGRDAAGEIIARGSAKTDVTAFASNSLAITMTYLSSGGTGRIILNFTLPAGGGRRRTARRRMS